MKDNFVLGCTFLFGREFTIKNRFILGY